MISGGNRYSVVTDFPHSVGYRTAQATASPTRRDNAPPKTQVDIGANGVSRERHSLQTPDRQCWATSSMGFARVLRRVYVDDREGALPVHLHDRLRGCPSIMVHACR